MSDFASNNSRKICAGLALFGALSVASLATAVCAAPARAAVFTVTTTADIPGPGGLRHAIGAANATVALDSIRINATGTIELTSALPVITNSLSIEGPGPGSLTIRRSVTQPFRIIEGNSQYASLSLSGVTIANGRTTAASTGGAGVGTLGPLQLIDVIVKDNASEHGGELGNVAAVGGGVAAAGATVIRTRITNNHLITPDPAPASQVSQAGGGGIGVGGPLVMEGSTVDGNSVTAGNHALGGGIAIFSDTAHRITRSTISGNSVHGSAEISGGAGILTVGGTLTVANSTVTGNKGGPNTLHSYNGTGQVMIKSSIVAGNGTADDCGAGVSSLGNNVFADSTCTPANDKVVLDAGLGGLAANGGATPTHAIPATSPAVDAGVAAGTHSDQRGVARVIDQPAVAATLGSDGADIGAYELQDVAEPDTAITSSGPVGATAQTSASVSFSSGGATFECRLDGGAWSGCSSPHPLSGLSEGTHTFGVRAIDAEGHVDSTPATRTWTVDTTAPNTTVLSGPTSGTDANTAAFTLASSEANGTFACRLDNTEPAPCASSYALAGLSTGAHSLTVTAADAAGNQDQTPVVYSWIVVAPQTTPASQPTPNAAPLASPAPLPKPPPTADRTPPDTRITKGPATTRSRAPKFSFTATEGASTFRCQIDKRSYRRCISGRPLARLRTGRHILRVAATDSAGNLDPTPAVRRFRIRRRS